LTDLAEFNFSDGQKEYLILPEFNLADGEFLSKKN